MKRIVFLFVACFLALSSFAADSLTCKIKIKGMTCGDCEAKVKESLSTLCAAVTIDRKNDEGVCTYQEGKATPDQIVKAVQDAGYTASVIN